MILLTGEEKALAANADVLLTKNKIIQAVYELFGQLADHYKGMVSDLPAEIRHYHPKISRGENYLGLPWVMLDYPRFFERKETFAIRAMFWWGHCFSLHLLLQGSNMQLLEEAKIGDGWFLSTVSDPWQHQFKAENAIPARLLTSSLLLQQAEKGFLKLSCYLPLTEWDGAEFFLKEKFKEAIEMIRTDTASSEG